MYRKNKFNANLDNKRRTEAERKRAWQLKIMERAGEIQGLSEQVRFELIPTQYDEDGKCIEQSCNYYADFTYWQNGKFVVEDVKGYEKGTAHDLYVIKRKLMLLRYNIRIKETKDGRDF